jgi:hypothetical protein
MLRLPTFEPLVILGVLAALILILCGVRIATRATKTEVVLSCAFLPVLLVVAALAVKSLNNRDLPVWGLSLGVGAAVLYAKLCGRDFSFVGQYLLSLIASTVALAIVAIVLGIGTVTTAFLMSTNALYLSFYVYDLASLLARRRLGEDAAAVVDLYRDIFNFFGYTLRVARHWKKHRIWAK